MEPEMKKAKEYLDAGDCTCVLCRGDTVYSSCRRGVAPLLEILDSGTDVRGYWAADKVVGRATAFLYRILGVRGVYARVASIPAIQVMEEGGIPILCDRTVEGIRNRQNTGPCPMEAATRELQDPEEALCAIRAALKTLQGRS